MRSSAKCLISPGTTTTTTTTDATTTDTAATVTISAGLDTDARNTLDGAFQHVTSLASGADESVMGKRLLDSGSEASMTTVKRGSRVQAIPPHLQPSIMGAGGGVIRATHRVWQRLPPCVLAIQPPGQPAEIPFLWGPGFRYDIIATSQLADVGISAVFCASERRAFLFAAGSDYRTPATRVACITAGGLWAVPGTFSYERPRATAAAVRLRRAPRAPRPTPPATTRRRTAKHVRFAVPTAAPVLPLVDTDAADDAALGGSTHVDNDLPSRATSSAGAVELPMLPDVREDGNDASDDTATASRQLRAVDYGQARMMLGNPSHADTLATMRHAGVRPIHVDQHRSRLDELRQVAVQMAHPMLRLPATGLERHDDVVILADTLGFKFPVSAAGNQYVIVWTITSDPFHVYASMSADHTAESTCRGFKDVCRAAGLTVLDTAIAQPVLVVTDNGTEFSGAFQRLCDAAGISRFTSTPNKAAKHEAQPAEGSNRALQRAMRLGLVMARANFEANGHDCRRYWDYLVQWSVNVIATNRRSKAGGTHELPHLSWAQIQRANGAPWGARAMATIHEHDPRRKGDHKQLSDRSVPGLYLGSTGNKKHRVLLRDGRIMVTSDVSFPHDAMNPVSGAVRFTDEDAWLLPFAGFIGDRDGDHDGDGTDTTPPRIGALPPAPQRIGAAASARAHQGAATVSTTVAEHAPRPTAQSVARSDTGSFDAAVARAHGDDAAVAPTASPTNAVPDVGGTAAAHATATPTAATASIAADGSDITDSADTDGTTIDLAAHTDSHDAHNGATTGDYFTDDNGVEIGVGDDVNIGWLSRRGQRRHQHHGTVTAIDNDADEYHVEYLDGSDYWHPITRAERMPVLKRALATTLRRRFDARSHQLVPRRTLTLVARRPQPHPDVLPFLDHNGNVLQKYATGAASLGPEPSMPACTVADEPPPPDTIYQALAHPFALWWLHSMVRERRGHLHPVNRAPTYHFTSRAPRGPRQLRTKWVFKIKRNSDGSIAKFKSRECLAGWHLRKGTDFVESWSGTTPWSDVLDLESLAALLRLEVWECDLTCAYAFARMPPTPSGDPVIAVSSPGMQVFDDDGRLQHQCADMAWYGHPAAGFALAQHLHGALTGDRPPDSVEVCTVPFVQNPYQPCMFKAEYPAGHIHHGEIFILHVSTDNLRTYGSSPAIQGEFMAWLRRNFDVTGGDTSLRDQPPQMFMGCRFTYRADGSVTIDMPEYIDGLLRETGMADANPAETPMTRGTVISLADAPMSPDEQQSVTDHANQMFGTHQPSYTETMSYYGHLVSSIGWIAHRVGPILQHAHSVLCRVLSAPTVAGFRAVKRTLRYLAGKRDLSRVYGPDPIRTYDWRNGDLPEWSISSDASYADDPHDRRGQGGYVGGYTGHAATTTTSKKTRRTCTSTDQSESDLAGSACKEAEYKRHWMHHFGLLRPGPTTLQVDNFATANRAGAAIRKWSPSSKQHDVNERYLAECVQRGIISVQHRPGSLPEDPRRGEGFPADAMTKALPRYATEFYFDALQGRRPPPIGARATVDATALCTVTSGVHSDRSRFVGLVKVQYDDGRSYHVSPERLGLYRGQE